jgi:hypothetical protein
LVFDTFFSLYFGLLVGGLRSEIGRRRQVRVLRETLTALIGQS